MIVEEMIEITTAIIDFAFPNGATAAQENGTPNKYPPDNTHNAAPHTDQSSHNC